MPWWQHIFRVFKMECKVMLSPLLMLSRDTAPRPTTVQYTEVTSYRTWLLSSILNIVSLLQNELTTHQIIRAQLSTWGDLSLNGRLPRALSLFPPQRKWNVQVPGNGILEWRGRENGIFVVERVTVEPEQQTAWIWPSYGLDGGGSVKTHWSNIFILYMGDFSVMDITYARKIIPF